MQDRRINAAGAFSPLTWGWSDLQPFLGLALNVFPTHVGMVRDGDQGRHLHRSFPHSRGDGPDSRAAAPVRASFSPLTWGWSVTASAFSGDVCVFPTHVGMVRGTGKEEKGGTRFPHSRGDGPMDIVEARRDWMFSPLTWGWSGMARCLQDRD